MSQNRMKTISTLLVTCWFPTDENPQQGPFVLDHAKSLSNSGIDTKILFIYIHFGKTTFNIAEKNYEKAGVPVLEIEITSKFWKFLYQWPLFLRKTILRLSENQFIADADIIHSHAIFPAGFFGWQLAGKLQKPFVLTEHWSRTQHFLKRHPLGFIGKKIYRNADEVIFVSKHLENNVTNLVKTQSTNIVANPIDETLFFYKPKPEKPPVRFILVAQWKKNGVKRGDLILEAFNEIKQTTNFSFQIDFVGIGTALDEYRNKAELYNLPVNFCGYEDKETLSKHLRSSHIFIHPTVSETFGIVVFEALKTGTPVLVSDLEVFKPHIHPAHGMLVENNVKAWRDAIIKAFSIQYNYEEIAETYKVPFSQSEIALKTKGVYEKAMKKRNSNRFKNL